MQYADYNENGAFSEDINRLVYDSRDSENKGRDKKLKSSHSRERSKSRERHYERPRDRDSYRGDRGEPYHDRYRESRDRHRDRDYIEKDRSRDRDRDRDRGRGGDRNRERDRDKHRDRGDADRPRGINKIGGYRIDFKNRATLFDIPPPGYENMPPAEFKILKASGALPVLAMPQGSSIILRARRLFIEDIPKDFDEDDFIDFVNAQLLEKKINMKPGNPAINVEKGEDGTYAYLELRTAEETTDAIVLDGALYKGVPLKVRRPKDYQPIGGFYYGVPQVSQDTLNKLFVACIPVFLNDEQVKELLCAFGELKAFNLVKDGASGLSKGYAFCEYRDPSVTDLAIAGLNGMTIVDKKLVVQRAVLGSRHGTSLGGIIPAQMQIPGLDPEQVVCGDNQTDVLCLMNMITSDDLVNDQEYEDIIDDIKTECSKYGEVISVEIPRPNPEIFVPGVGKIYVQFATPDMCKQAHDGLAGRKFDGRMVITSYYSTDKYKKREF